MKSGAKPLFLARQGYRRRRLGDAARALPVLGAVLWLLPLLALASNPRTTSGAGIYLFLVWLGLIVAAAVLGRGLSRGMTDGDG